MKRTVDHMVAPSILHLGAPGNRLEDRRAAFSAFEKERDSKPPPPKTIPPRCEPRRPIQKQILNHARHRP